MKSPTQQRVVAMPVIAIFSAPTRLSILAWVYSPFQNGETETILSAKHGICSAKGQQEATRSHSLTLAQLRIDSKCDVMSTTGNNVRFPAWSQTPAPKKYSSFM